MHTSSIEGFQKCIYFLYFRVVVILPPNIEIRSGNKKYVMVRSQLQSDYMALGRGWPAYYLRDLHEEG